MPRTVPPPVRSGTRCRRLLSIVMAGVGVAGGALIVPAVGGEAIAAETSVSASSTDLMEIEAGEAATSAVEVSGTSGTVRSVEVRIDGLTHTNQGDLNMSLTSPAGTEIGLLGSCSGAFAANDLDLHFAADGTPVADFANLEFNSQPIRPTTCTGSLSTDLTDLIDEDPAGEWTLTAASASATGSIDGWTLDLVVDEPPQIAFTTGLDNPLVVEGSASLTYTRPTLTAPFTVAGSPAHGSVDLDGGTGGFTYTPDTGYSGADSFSGTDDEGTPFTVDITVDSQGAPGGTTRIGASSDPFELGAGGSIGSSPTSTAIDIGAGSEVVAEAEVTLVAFEHELLRHVMAAIEAPGGNATTLIDNCGDDYSIGGDITFAEDGTALPNQITGTPGALDTGTYQPQRCVTDSSAHPGIGDVTDVGFDPFDAEGADGTWELYLYDDGPAAEGTVDGWTLRLVTIDAEDVVTVPDPAPHVFRTTPQTPLYVDGSATAVATGEPVENVTGIDDSATTGEVTLDAATGSFAYVPPAGFTGVDSFDVLTVSAITTTVQVIVDGEPAPGHRIYVADEGSGMDIIDHMTVEQSMSLTDPANPLAPDPTTAQIVGASATIFGLEHTYADDVEITLRNGTHDLVLLRRCGGEASITDVDIEFVDGASSIPGGIPVTGQFPPTLCHGVSGTFGASFVGHDLDADGPWTLRTFDLWNGDVGSLASWRTVVTVAVPLDLDDGTFHALEDTALSVPTASGLTTLASGTEASAATYDVVDVPQHGTLELAADGGFDYTPDPDFAGSDSFTVTATAAGHTTEPAAITVEVEPVNDLPTVSDAAFSVVAGEQLVADLGDLATDAEGDPLTFALAAASTHGTVDLAPDGSFTYTSDPEFVGTDEFSFVVDDDGAASATRSAPAQRTAPTARVSIEVTATDGPSDTDEPSDAGETSEGDAPAATHGPSAGTLPDAGAGAIGPVVSIALLLLLGGGAILAIHRRRGSGTAVAH